MADILKALDPLEEELRELTAKLVEPAAMADARRMAALGKRRRELEEVVLAGRRVRELARELEEARAMAAEESDPAFRELAREEAERLRAALEEAERGFRLLLLPKDPNDERNVIVEIRAGTGGDESALFAADLFKMYQRYAEAKKWKLETIDVHETGIGGFKEIIFSLEGKGVYSRMKYESGVHRVQRVPETESQGRVHTSAATVAVLPEADEVEVKIDPDDLRIDVFRSTGPGGQGVNTTDSAVRITHIPTGIVVTCQNERSQTQNRETALRVLRARLMELEEEKRQRELAEIKGKHVEAAWGNQIRSYVLHPYQLVKDHRTGYETGNTQAVLDGELDTFMEAYLKSQVG